MWSVPPGPGDLRRRADGTASVHSEPGKDQALGRGHEARARLAVAGGVSVLVSVPLLPVFTRES